MIRDLPPERLVTLEQCRNATTDITRLFKPYTMTPEEIKAFAPWREFNDRIGDLQNAVRALPVSEANKWPLFDALNKFLAALADAYDRRIS
jgi:hypothetical protein